MNLDYECAILELTDEEGVRFRMDEDFRAEVISSANDIADATDRTVIVYAGEVEISIVKDGVFEAVQA